MSSSDPNSSPALGQFRGWRGRPLSQLLAAWGGVLLVISWLLVGLLLVRAHGEALRAGERENGNLARAYVETTLRVIATLDHATRRLAAEVQAQGAESAPVVAIAGETGLVPDILVQLSLIGPDGRFLRSNLDPDGRRSGPVDLSQREHVRVHLQPEPGRSLPVKGLFIGPPVLGKVSGRWTIQVSRHIVDPQGLTLGVIVASLDPSYFESTFRHVKLGPRSVLTLVGQDRIVRARIVEGRSEGLGRSLDEDHPVGRSDLPEHGSYTRASALDGIERVIAYARVGAYPLVMLVGTATEEVLGEWRRLAILALSLMSALTLLVSLSLWAITHGLRRLEHQHQALLLSEARAQAANQAKSEFLAAISHELRTPLTSIRGFAELMEQRLGEPKFRHSASLIRRSAEHLNTLLTEILDLAKVEAGAMRLSPGPVELRPALEATVDFFQVTAAEKGLDLSLEQQGPLPSRAQLDELRLKQILNNLLSNALKFTQAGRVTLHAGTEDEGRTLVLTVSDTGPGIPEDKQALIFERFRQADARIAQDHGGTGLGLTLARSLAQLMGGTLTLKSRPGEGAAFTCRLPLIPVSD